ncbi:MAG: hypothetical protein JXX29_14440 [Deltaproteobacteria bacterium]|nr:hypothetical protein [Deltaproteobacteria bacterium]MBN2672878.1 hypothetical protein [Deltaproteobacteria bacterium]
MGTSSFLVNLAGWIPAVVFPSATGWQLFKIVKSKNAAGVSVLTWLLFGIANIGLYVYTEKFGSFQSIFGFLGTAMLDFLIVGITIYLRPKKHT